MYVILVYDIKTDYNGQRVLNRTFKTCKKYLSHIQNSVFEGELSESLIIRLKYELDDIIRKDIDSIILFKSSNEKWLIKDMWENRRIRLVILYNCLYNIMLKY